MKKSTAIKSFIIILTLLIILFFTGDRLVSTINNMLPKTAHIDYLSGISPNTFLDYQELGDKREAHYNGIIPVISWALEGLFENGEINVRDKLIESFDPEPGRRGAHEALWLFRTQDHVDHFNEIICKEGKIADNYTYAIPYVSSYTNRLEDFFTLAKCMDANITSSNLWDMYHGSEVEEQIHGQKYYRYALYKGYVRDFRLERLKGHSTNPQQIKRSELFIRLGDLALITEADASIMLPQAVSVAKEFKALGESTMISELLAQFDHCGKFGCSTPEWEGTLFAIGLIKDKRFLLDYMKNDGIFTKDLAKNTHYFTTAGNPLIDRIKAILLAKPLPEDIDPHDEGLRKKVLLGNLSPGFTPTYYNPYHLRHQKLHEIF